MISLIDKVKTIIAYAKFGEFFARRKNGETLIDELFFPPAVKSINYNWNEGENLYCKKISGYLQVFSGTALLSDNKPTEEIDLPFCTLISSNPTNSTANTTLKILKWPSYTKVINNNFANLRALEYLELGVITSFSTNALTLCYSLKEFYNKEGTTSSLFLFDCPNLTQECLHKIIENYADMSQTTAPTFHIGEENLAKIDEEHITMLEAKNIIYQ